MAARQIPGLCQVACRGRIIGVDIALHWGATSILRREEKKGKGKEARGTDAA